jgi:hypothetical protein
MRVKILEERMMQNLKSQQCDNCSEAASRTQFVKVVDLMDEV